MTSATRKDKTLPTLEQIESAKRQVVRCFNATDHTPAIAALKDYEELIEKVLNAAAVEEPVNKEARVMAGQIQQKSYDTVYDLINSSPLMNDSNSSKTKNDINTKLNTLSDKVAVLCDYEDEFKASGQKMRG